MKILAVDTALGACSVALLDGNRILSHRFEAMNRGHAEALAPMVADATQEAGIAFSAFDRLAVTTGPGTFTGQRVGLAFMRGLRIALKLPLAGITTLEAMGAAAMAEAGTSRAGVLHDARHGEVYMALVSAEGILIEPAVLALEAAVGAMDTFQSEDVLALAGTAAEQAMEKSSRNNHARMTSVRQPDALWVARLAASRSVLSGPPRPLYLRAPDAKLPAANS